MTRRESLDMEACIRPAGTATYSLALSLPCIAAFSLIVKSSDRDSGFPGIVDCFCSEESTNSVYDGFKSE